MPLLGGLIAGVFELGKTWLHGRVERRKVKTEAESAVVKAKGEAEASALKSAAETDDKWRLIMAKASEGSWKDELLTITFVTILVINFIPYEPIQQAMLQGWENLAKAPEWFTWSFMACVGASFGVKGWKSFTN